MKPVNLRMKNIGPYADERIDFTKLDNMFLIKGDTGAGKSFIFDSMTFALYGDLRGNRKGHVKDFKSRYAKDEDDAFVEFTFANGNSLYHIERSVPFSYTNRNGKISSKTQRLVVKKIVDGKEQELVGNLTELNSKIQEIIGLSADEFSRIVVLPQGEFAEFLHQSSNERTVTLEKLFPVDFYSRISDRIKEKVDAESEELKAVTNLIRTLTEEKDFSDAEEKIKNQNEEIKKLSALSADLIEKKSEIAGKIEKLRHEKADADEYEENCQKLKNLQAKEKDFEALNQKIAKADKAKGLKENISLYESSAKNHSEAKENLAQAQNKMAEFQASYNQLESKKDEMAELKKQTENDSSKLSLLEEKLKKASQAQEKKLALEKLAKNRETFDQEKNQKKGQIEEINSKLGGKSAAEKLQALSDEILSKNNIKAELKNEKSECKNRDDLLSKKALALSEKENLEKEKIATAENLERTQQTLVQILQKKKDQETKNLAYTISLCLEKDSPCPVCGSLQHPRIAEKPEGLLDFDEQIKTFEGNIKIIQNSLSQTDKKISAEEEKIRGYEENLSKIKSDRQLTLVEEEFNSLCDQIEELEKNSDEVKAWANTLEKLKKEYDAAVEKFNQADKEYSGLEGELKELENSAGDSLERLQEEKKFLQEKIAGGKKNFETWENSFNQTGTKLAAEKKSVAQYQDDLEKYEKQAAADKKLLEEKIADSVFADLAEVKQNIIEDSELEKNRKNYNQFCGNLQSAKDAVEASKKKNPLPAGEILKKLEEAGAEERTISEQLEKNNNDLNAKQTEYHDYQSTFEKIRAEQDKKLALEKELEPLKALSDNLNGSNPQKLPFKTWALTLYFEQVLDFASRRFYDISDGRFTFSLKKPEDGRGNGLRGLDLQVFDSHSGKMSDAADLSGGETFEASLSLALAITDVVQNSNGGGIQLDSLFIDEGFGTLDPDTLEKAMAVLTEIGETKMVGMISHVSEMETYSGITSAILVDKSDTGSKIRLR